MPVQIAKAVTLLWYFGEVMCKTVNFLQDFLVKSQSTTTENVDVEFNCTDCNQSTTTENVNIESNDCNQASTTKNFPSVSDEPSITKELTKKRQYEENWAKVTNKKQENSG
ncbi:unnamed protein product [Parnassius apollo]|uniref:(apollo) hypothetical protein n=1 Tax=Parnassius apollo TaxID=110799 RepID=A0A8S3WLD5_PARAO|nr:unnamed protein product [Parnassius apollo]